MTARFIRDGRRPGGGNGDEGLGLHDFSEVKALTFDVFGTVVDWRGTIVEEGEEWGRQREIDKDWAAFADAWRAGYGPAMGRVTRGESPWMNIDGLHRMILDEILERFGIEGLSEEEKERWNRVWHRLNPWPDSVGGLARLREKYTVATFSNGNVSLLVNMAKNAGLTWDCVLSAELFRKYKGELDSYREVAALLGLEPRQVMMVAAHNGDLLRAREVGFRTAFVLRAAEHGPGQATDLEANPAVDIAAADFEDLADKLSEQKE